MLLAKILYSSWLDLEERYIGERLIGIRKSAMPGAGYGAGRKMNQVYYLSVVDLYLEKAVPEEVRETCGKAVVPPNVVCC